MDGTQDASGCQRNFEIIAAAFAFHGARSPLTRFETVKAGPKPGPSTIRDKNDILFLVSGFRGFEVGNSHKFKRLEAAPK